MKQENTISGGKEKWERMRAPYTWHLRPPFNKDFDAQHWWLGKAPESIKPYASLYELARRHPRIGELRLKYRKASWHGFELKSESAVAKHVGFNKKAISDLTGEPESIRCLCQIGLLSWHRLPSFLRDFWVNSIGSLKGIERRNPSDCCNPITIRALTKENTATHSNPTQSIKQPRVGEVKTKNKSANDITTKVEQAILLEALRMHRQGHLLFSFPSDLQPGQAEFALRIFYGKHSDYSQLKKPQRQRDGSWLPAIQQYEEAIHNLKGGKRNIFTTYKRIIDGVDFER